jgi:O-antigen ligase
MFVGLALVVDMQLPFLPMLRGVDQATLDYRAELLDKSMQVFMERPWLGSDQYVERLTELGMVQGQGIVDIVNTYLGIALSSGALGLTFFLSIFTIVLRGIWKSGRQYAHNEAQGLTSDAASGSTSKSQGESPSVQATLLGRVLLASLLGTLVTIGTASSISVIPWVYWAWIGTSVAYVRMAHSKNIEPLVPP